MDLGTPQEIVEVELPAEDAPQPYVPEEAPEETPIEVGVEP